MIPRSVVQGFLTYFVVELKKIKKTIGMSLSVRWRFKPHFTKKVVFIIRHMETSYCIRIKILDDFSVTLKNI